MKIHKQTVLYRMLEIVYFAKQLIYFALETKSFKWLYFFLHYSYSKAKNQTCDSSDNVDQK